MAEARAGPAWTRTDLPRVRGAADLSRGGRKSPSRPDDGMGNRAPPQPTAQARAHLCMKFFVGISNFLEELSSFSHSIVFLCFFALLIE